MYLDSVLNLGARLHFRRGCGEQPPRPWGIAGLIDPEPAAPLEPALQLAALEFHHSAAGGTTFCRSRLIADVSAMIFEI